MQICHEEQSARSKGARLSPLTTTTQRARKENLQRQTLAPSSGRHETAVKTRKTISTIAIIWPVKAIFEKRAATLEVDTLVSPPLVL